MRFNVFQRSGNVLNCKEQKSLSAKLDFHFFFFHIPVLTISKIKYSLEYHKNHLNEVCLCIKSKHGEEQGRYYWSK